MKKTLLTVGLMAMLLMAGKAHALLIDRGNGLIYDGVNNISWTKDADISGGGKQLGWSKHLRGQLGAGGIR